MAFLAPAGNLARGTRSYQCFDVASPDGANDALAQPHGQASGFPLAGREPVSRCCGVGNHPKRIVPYGPPGQFNDISGTVRMRKIFARLLTLVAVCGALVIALSGCGAGDPNDPANNNNNNSSSNNNNNNNNQTGSDLAPASIGDNTIHGAFQSPHDPTVTLHFHITTVGTTSGTYTY